MSKQLVFKVKVIPKASPTGFAGEMADGTLKIRVAAPPEKGKANQELIAFLARHHGVSKSAVEIIAGASSQRKQIRVTLL